MSIRLILLFVFGVILLQFVHSQNINIDQLTDKQLQQFIEKAEAGGYSEDQLILMARARGMSDAEISALRTRIEALRSTMGISTEESLTTMDSRSRSFFGDGNLQSTLGTAPGIDPFESLKGTEDQLAGKLQIFGMEIFQNKLLNFEPSLNIATPRDYQIGPGDQIIIDVWGASEQNYQLYVSPEGNIIIPGVGPVYLNGYDMDKAEARILSRLKTIYSTLGSQTFAQVSLGQIRSIKVSIVGEVVNPGAYTLSSMSTAFSALYAAGGPTLSGSLRAIQVYRNGKNAGTLDAYNFLIKGESINFKLEDQDILIVKPYSNRVSVSGQVKRPAYYELQPTESFDQLIEFAGGFTTEAYTRTFSVRRNLDNSRTVLTLIADSTTVFTPKNGDEIQVSKIGSLFENRIRVEGAVNHADEFQFKSGMKLSEALKLAGGLRGDAYLERALIIRQQKDFSLTTLTFSPMQVMEGTQNLDLMQEDLIRIQSIYDLKEEYSVTIFGEVNLTGSIPYIKDMTLFDLLYLSNGLKETASQGQIEIARRIMDGTAESEMDQISKIFTIPINNDLKLDEIHYQFQLQPHDRVVVRKSPYYDKQAMVEIEGEVLFPGKYSMKTKTEKISDMISRSGGLTSFAFPLGATLIRRSEYFQSEGENDLEAAARIRRAELDALFARDTLSRYSIQLKKEESIGIDLVEIMKNPGGKYDLVLKEGDIISIPRELQTIRIRGEVLYPSVLKYEKSKSLKKFVAASGGFSENALKKRIYVLYPNGSANKTSSFLGFKNYPPISPGSEVIVPQKAEKERLGAQEIVGFSSALLSMALIIDRLTR